MLPSNQLHCLLNLHAYALMPAARKPCFSRDRVRCGPSFKRDLVFCLTQNPNTQSIVLQTLFPITPSQTTQLTNCDVLGIRNGEVGNSHVHAYEALGAANFPAWCARCVRLNPDVS